MQWIDGIAGGYIGNTTKVRAGDRRKTYDAERVEDISTRRQPDRQA